MTFSAMMTLVRASVTAVASATVKTVRTGYIFESATGQTTYNLLVVNPPEYVIPDTRNWRYKEYLLRWYLVAPDVGASGDTMTDTERETAWGTLDTVNKAIIQNMTATTSNFQINGDLKVQYNSGGPQQLLPDQVVYIEVTFKVRVNDC